MLSSDENTLKVDDAAKIIGCWKALSKQGASEDLIDDVQAMRREVAFCKVIEPSTHAKTHKVSSKNIASMFKAVVDAYQQQEIAQSRESVDVPALFFNSQIFEIGSKQTQNNNYAK